MAKTASDSLICSAISATAVAFWSLFTGLLCRAYVARIRDARARRRSQDGLGCRVRLRGHGRGVTTLQSEDVAGTGRVHLDDRAHRRGDGDRAQVATLGGRGLRADELLDDGHVVLQQLTLVERGLADVQVDDRGAVRAVLDLAGLRLLDGPGHVHRDRADLRVRHLALRAEDAAETADDGHHVRRRDGDVEVGEALLDALGEVVGADDVGPGLLGLARLVALGEDGDRDVLAEAVGQRDGAAQLLVGVADVQARAHVDLDGLVELRALEVLDELDRLDGRVLTLAVDLALHIGVVLAVLGHD